MRAVRAAVLALLVAVAAQMTACAASQSAGKAEGDAAASWSSGSRLVEEWGVEILGVRQSAAGYMLDWRYKVLDAEKALAITNRKIKPYLVEQRSGTKVFVRSSPKIGPLRSTDTPEEGRVYFVIFANPARFIKPGDKVTLVVGDHQVEDIVVQ